MLISESKQFIFVHVTKTGGSSINAMLRPYALPRRKSRLRSLQRQFGRPSDFHKFAFPKHGGLAIAERQLPPELYASCFKFGFVRNPWDRLVSEYSALLAKPDHRRYRRVAGKDFKHYLRREAPRIVSSQARQLADASGKIGVDFVGRFEHFERDFRTVCERLDIEIPDELAWGNRSRHGDYHEYYDDESRRFVAEHWADDIELFGYEF